MQAVRWIVFGFPGFVYTPLLDFSAPICDNTNMMKRTTVLIMIATLLTTAAAVAESIHPGPNPALDKAGLKEVMLFGGSGTIGDGVLKAWIMRIK